MHCHCSIVLGLVVLAFNNFAIAQETASAQPTRYAFTVVAAPNSSSSLVGGINDHDQISGWYVNADGIGIHSFILEDGEFNVFDFPGAISTSATGINDRAQVVGAYQFEFDPMGRGFIYDRGQFTSLDVTFANVQGTLPAALNDQGSVVGTYYDGTWHGFLYQRDKLVSPGVALVGLGGRLAEACRRQRHRALVGSMEITYVLPGPGAKTDSPAPPGPVRHRDCAQLLTVTPTRMSPGSKSGSISPPAWKVTC